MEITLVVLAAIVVGIVEIIKGLGINSKVIPVIALLVGVGVMFLAGVLVDITSVREQVIVGLMLGLSAMGLYSGGKTLTE